MQLLPSVFCLESCRLATADTVAHVDAVSFAAGASDADERRFLSDTQNSVSFVVVCAGLSLMLKCMGFVVACAVDCGGWWRWALLSLDGVAPIRMVGVSASVNLLLQYKVQKFSSGTGSPGWSQKKGRKTVVAVVL